MRPLAFHFPYWLVLAAVFTWAFVAEARIVNRARRAVADRTTPHDRGSLQVVMATQFLGSAFAFGLAWSPYGRIANQLIAFWVGIAVILAGAVLRRLCFRALGESFTGEVRVREEQRVITTGPYRFVRHPAYTAGILMSIGVGIALGTWLGTVLSGASALIGYAYRVRVEERALLGTLGAPYRDYMSRTTRFIPFVL